MHIMCAVQICSVTKVNAPICANLRLKLNIKIQKFIVKLFFREKFCFIY